MSDEQGLLPTPLATAPVSVFAELVAADLDKAGANVAWAERFGQHVFDLVSRVAADHAAKPRSYSPSVPMRDPETPELYQHFAMLIVEVLSADGVTSDVAIAQAETIVGKILQDFGGDNIYFPRCSHLVAREIVRRFEEGATVHQLTTEFKLSLGHINLLIRKARANRKAKREMDSTPKST